MGTLNDSSLQQGLYLKGVDMKAHERRSEVTHHAFEKPMTTIQLAAAIGAGKNIIRQDIRALMRRGVIVPDGWDDNTKLRTYRATRIVLAAELAKNTCNSKPGVSSRQFDIENIPPELRILYGYTEIRPRGGRKVNNENFHPTPVRVARVKVYPGTSWGMMEMAL